MARTALVPQVIAPTGIVPAYTAANVDGHSIPGDGDTILHVKNGSVASINVTIQTGGTYEGEAVADKVVAVAAGAEKFIGRFRPQLYNQPSGADAGKIYVDFSAVTTVTCAAFDVS